jgi:hypothetical protein
MIGLWSDITDSEAQTKHSAAHNNCHHLASDLRRIDMMLNMI